MQQPPLTVERTFNAPIDRVWSAITNNAEMKQWYFDLEDFKPEVGFECVYTKETENGVFVHIFKVTEVIPPKKLTYSWKYEGYPGNSFVTFELFPEGDKTRLKLTHTGLETFGDAPALARKNFEQGWSQIIGISLADYLEGEAA